jgi:hypothetical protein
MNTNEHVATEERSAPEHYTPERPAQERKEPTYLFTEKYVADKSEIAPVHRNPRPAERQCRQGQ